MNLKPKDSLAVMRYAMNGALKVEMRLAKILFRSLSRSAGALRKRRTLLIIKI